MDVYCTSYTYTYVCGIEKHQIRLVITHQILQVSKAENVGFFFTDLSANLID
jgi:hypothetical protein